MACEPGISQSTSKSAIEKVLDDQLKASKFAMHVDSSQRRKCYYTEIPHVIKQRGVHGQELTNLNLDKVISTGMNSSTYDLAEKSFLLQQLFLEIVS